jgi:hypothetical protein
MSNFRHYAYCRERGENAVNKTGKSGGSWWLSLDREAFVAKQRKEEAERLRLSGTSTAAEMEKTIRPQTVHKRLSEI